MSATTNAERLKLTVAEEVRVLLARRRLSGVKLAELIGRSQVYVSRRLRGEVAFDVEDGSHDRSVTDQLTSRNTMLYDGEVTNRKLTAPQAARRIRVQLRTWWAYVSRSQAPPPDGREEVSNRAWWYTSTVDQWMATRPGRGAPGQPRRRAG